MKNRIARDLSRDDGEITTREIKESEKELQKKGDREKIERKERKEEGEKRSPSDDKRKARGGRTMEEWKGIERDKEE